MAGADLYRNSPTGSSAEIGSHSKWAWGFQLEADYRFLTGNDFNVNWYHYRNNSSSSQTPISLSNTLIHNPIGGNLDYYQNVTVTNASTHINFAWDQVNMELGKHLDLGQTDYVRFHGGLNFSRVAGNNISALIGSTTNAQLNVSNYDLYTNLDTSFNGLGARIGIDLTHQIMHRLDIYADGAFSLIAGSNHTSNNNSDTISGVLYNVLISAVRVRAVPELDAKIGASYGIELAQGSLNLNAGWLWAAYSNTLTCKENNFNIQGVYFGLKWDGNIA